MFCIKIIFRKLTKYDCRQERKTIIKMPRDLMWEISKAGYATTFENLRQEGLKPKQLERQKWLLQ